MLADILNEKINLKNQISMKKQILLILLLIPVFGISQSLLDSIQLKIEEEIQHLNQTNVPSNILYERTFQKANLTAFHR